MLTEESIYNKYNQMTQELFAEVEVYLVELPEDALRRIVEFFFAMAAYENEQDDVTKEIHLQNANLALEQANCHCHKVLVEEYQRLAQNIIDRYGDHTLQKIDNGDFYVRIQRKQNELKNAIHYANEMYEAKAKEVAKDPYYTYCKPGSVQEDEMSAKIAESSEVRDAFRSAYEIANGYYNMLINDEERETHLNEYKAYEERLKPEKQIATNVGIVGFILGIAGIVIWVVRRIIGV